VTAADESFLNEYLPYVLRRADQALSTTVTHAVRRLEERGLVSRVLGTDDKRQRFVSITATGSRITRTLIDEAKQLEAEALATTGDLSQLVAHLNELIKTVEAHAKLRAEDHAHAG